MLATLKLKLPSRPETVLFLLMFSKIVAPSKGLSWSEYITFPEISFWAKRSRGNNPKKTALAIIAVTFLNCFVIRRVSFWLLDKNMVKKIII